MKSFYEMCSLIEAERAKVNKGHVVAHLRTLPHVVGKYDPSHPEWQIKPRGSVGDDDTYFTSDHQDAMDTASVMNNHIADKLSN